MRRFIFTALVLAAAGCAAYVTPRGTYIEPLLPPIVLGPPVIIAPAPGIVVAPLPPVVLVPGRHLYFYNNYYYYYYDGGWYWGRDQRGPWHVLPKDRWPSKMERRGEERGRGGPPMRGRDRY